jgi:hypothetical protein
MWILKLLSLYLFGRLLLWVYNFIRSLFFLRKANFGQRLRLALLGHRHRSQ